MRSVTKSRYGCSRCKRQKVRCDQAKPGCGRCTRVGVQCPGYSQPLKWSTKYEKLDALRAPPPASSRPDSVSISSPQLSSSSPYGAFSLDLPEFIATGSLLDDLFSFNETLISADAATVEGLEMPNQETTVLSLGSDDALGLSERQEALALAESSTSTPLRRSLTDVSTVLTEFYFKEAASLYSVYDSAMNPFRSTVAQLWPSSRLLHCTLQSMSAACLLKTFPYLAESGKQLRNEAITILRSQDEPEHTSLLALLMLGGSSSWHATEQTGAEYFNLARQRLVSMVATNELQKNSNNYHFFEEALIYWELLLTYVDDNVEPAPAPEVSTEGSIYSPSRHIPHPWTGVARDTQVLVQEVGRLVRRCRVLARSGAFTTASHIEQLQQSLSSARMLESKLLALSYPEERDVVSPGDRLTPVWHLLTLAEVYRRTGLVQLYRVFPDLLDDRFGDWLASRTDYETSDRASRALLYVDLTDRDEWMTTYALETLKMLETIPLESGTRDFQPFLLVALCSELRLPSLENSQTQLSPSSLDPSRSAFLALDTGQDGKSFNGAGTSTIILSELSMHSIQIVRMRQFILDRLTSFMRILPPKPMQVCLNIVKESWVRLDGTPKRSNSSSGCSKVVYWMDVMMDNKWETCMA